MTTRDTLTVIHCADHGIPGLTDAKLQQMDAYLRTVCSDKGRPHILVFFNDERQLDLIIGYSRNWLTELGYVSFGLHRQRWNAEEQRIDPKASVKADIAFVRVYENDAVEGGLMIHELSHLSGTSDGSPNQIGSASYWEQIGNWVFSGRFRGTTAEQVRHFNTLYRIYKS